MEYHVLPNISLSRMSVYIYICIEFGLEEEHTR